MNIAIISSGVVTNATVFDDLETAQSFLLLGVYPGADDVRVIPDGYGIGDLYDAQTDTWTCDPSRPVVPDPEPIVESDPIDYDTALLDLDYRVSLLELGGEII